MNLQQRIRKALTETLESKWNNGYYDYQHGFCHYFAYNIIDKIRKRFPNKKVNYFLLLAEEIDDEGDSVDDYLIHVYIKIDDILLDSNGVTTMDKAMDRLDGWEDRQRKLIPDNYEIETWGGEEEEIPDYFFNNKFCNTSKVRKDMEEFLNNPIVNRILRDK
jgi:hypothetical protein